MKRLFVAVDLDNATRVEVSQIISVVSGLSRTRVTWVKPDRLHLTIEFFGEVDHVVERRVMSALAEPIPVAPFSLEFEGLGLFPSRGAPRVLWLGISEGLNQLRRIHELLGGRLAPGERRREEFNPHLTLARFRDRVPRAQLEEVTAMKAFAGPCRIDRVTLYESRLSPKGPTYAALAEGQLT